VRIVWHLKPIWKKLFFFRGNKQHLLFQFRV
jgi:hypothetical protein